MDSLRPLISRVETRPYQFEFVQLMRILGAAQPDRAQIGADAALQREFVRLLTHTANDFPAAEVHQIDGDLAAGDVPRVQVNFLGMTGTLGALPRFYTDILLQRMAEKDATLRDFLDLFNHRLLSLFFRAWSKYRFWIQEERAGRQQRFSSDSAPDAKPVSEALLAYVGLLGPGLLHRSSHGNNVPRLEVREASFRYFSGFFSSRRRPARNLERALRFLFSWPVAIEQFVGRWLHLDDSEKTRLGSRRTGEIGVSAVVGSKVWDVQSMFRVQNGPLDYRQFESLLPIGDAYRTLTEFTRLFVGGEFDFSLELILWSREIPACRLGKAPGLGSRLGWNTWLCSRPIETPTVSVEIQVRSG